MELTAALFAESENAYRRSRLISEAHRRSITRRLATRRQHRVPERTAPERRLRTA